jgi:hypothetical protein
MFKLEALRAKGLQEQFNLHFVEKTSCPQKAPANNYIEFQEKCMEMVVT